MADGGAAVLSGMALPKRHAEVRLIGLEAPLNEHVIKLLAFDMPEERRAYFRKEVRNWLREIQAMRLKDSGRPGKAGWYYGLLFDGPFGGFEERNVATVCEGIEDRYGGSLVRNATPVPVLVERLRAFHEELSRRAARGEPLTGLAEGL
jgi:hypothetical protein